MAKRKKKRWLLRLGNRLVALVVFIAAIAVGFVILTWPDVSDLAESNPESTAFIERARDRGVDVRWRWVDYDSISTELKRAVVVAEDISFFSHNGFDTEELKIAAREAMTGKRLRGASTITQQLAKNLWLSPSRSPFRKFKEVILTRQLETHLSKQRILEVYLNVVEFGPGIWGIRDAADAWFLKQPDQLSVREAAFLASILPAPRMWHQRITDSGRVPRTRVNGVLDRMRRRGSLSHADHALATAETLRVVPPTSPLPGSDTSRQR